MIRFMLGWVITSLMLLLILSLMTMAIGSTRHDNPAVSELTVGCEATYGGCWYGVVNSITTLNDAKALLAEHGFTEAPIGMGLIHGQPAEAYHRPPRDGCNTVTLSYLSASENPRIIIQSLGQCQGVYVGDMIEAYGEPEMIAFGNAANLIVFRNGVQVHFIGAIEPLTPFTNITPSSLFPFNADVALPWDGYIPAWRYCVLMRLNRCV